MTSSCNKISFVFSQEYVLKTFSLESPFVMPAGGFTIYML